MKGLKNNCLLIVIVYIGWVFFDNTANNIVLMFSLNAPERAFNFPFSVEHKLSFVN